MSVNQKRKLRVGHSPDADDAYMFYALANGAVKISDFEIEHVIEDIQSLNRRALSAELEITAISAAVYPEIADKYWILASGASVGRNYGPILVSRQPISLKEMSGKRIAVPGPQTTANLLLHLYVEHFIPVQMDFNDVIPAVKNGTVDVALVIHEGQLNYASQGMQLCVDLGQLWFKDTNLPIPLGLDIVRKDLGWDLAVQIQKGLKNSILHAMKNQPQALEYAAQFGRGTVGQTLKKFVEMYVNQDTVDLGQEGKKALNELFSRAVEKKLIKKAPTVEVIEASETLSKF